ncbi:MAG: PIG-L family deacetylase [Erythrobacter sp.]|uniref:PIG-L deacetylase family protein n=1 Tax=Erythrobacter sp. TaxID=1042 RepID=UPI003C77724A
MSRVLAVSPHLDDAVFSAGATLARHAGEGDEVVVLTCLTGNVARPEGFALACQLDKGLGPDVDYMALRRTEDTAACEHIGARAVHWPFLEAPHRGYGDAAALFGPARADDDLADRLAPELAALFEELRPDTIYGPYGVGEHVDHRAVRAALSRVTGKAIWWEDFPYAMREDRAVQGIVRHEVDDEWLAVKGRAALAYQSQVGFQFGSPQEAAKVLGGWRCEGFSDGPAA